MGDLTTLVDVSVVISDTLLVVCGLLVLILHPKTNYSTCIKWFFAAHAICTLLSTLVGQVLHLSNWWIYQFTFLFHLILVYRFFSHFNLHLFYRTLFYACLIFYVGDSLWVNWQDYHYNLGKPENLRHFQNHISCAVSLGFSIVLCLQYMFLIYRRAEDIQLIDHPPFLFTVGILFYSVHAFCTFLFGYESIATQISDDFFNLLWIFTSFGVLLLSVFAMFGTYSARKNGVALWKL